MKVVYASRTGNVQLMIDQLLISESLQIKTGKEIVSEAYLLFTYTDGYGEVPIEVSDFLTNNSNFIQGVIVSGDKGYGEAFCKAGDIISQEFDVPCLYRFENNGTDADVSAIQDIIDNV